MKKTSQILIGTIGLACASAWTSTADAQMMPAPPALTANASFTTNYVFRGITQSANRPAVQGGLDYTIGDSGFAVGTWVSSIDFGDHTPFEWDLYANYDYIQRKYDPSPAFRLRWIGIYEENEALIKHIGESVPKNAVITCTCRMVPFGSIDWSRSRRPGYGRRAGIS